MNELLLDVKNVQITNEKEDNALIVSIPSWKLNHGDSVFIMGENGAGKSTIIKTLFSHYAEDNYALINEEAEAILHSQYNYEINLNGFMPIDEKDAFQSFIYIAQEEEFGAHDSIIKSLEYPSVVAIRNLSDRYDDYSERLNKIKTLVNDYALKYFSDIYKYEKKYLACKKTANDTRAVALKILNKKKAKDCSGGQKKLISLLSAIIKAKIIEPDLLVLDEPLNHLDFKNKKIVSSLLSEIKKEREVSKPISYIIVSHCMVFDFINEKNVYQYNIVDNELKGPIENKVYHSCLEDNTHC